MLLKAARTAAKSPFNPLSPLSFRRCRSGQPWGLSNVEIFIITKSSENRKSFFGQNVSLTFPTQTLTGVKYLAVTSLRFALFSETPAVITKLSREFGLFLATWEV